MRVLIGKHIDKTKKTLTPVKRNIKEILKFIICKCILNPGFKRLLWTNTVPRAEKICQESDNETISEKKAIHRWHRLCHAAANIFIYRFAGR